MPTLDARPAKLDIVAAAGDDVAVTLTTTTTTWLDGETLSAPVTTFDGTATGVSFTTSWSAGTLQLSLTDTATGTTLGEGSYKWRLTGTEGGVTSTHLAGVLRLTAQSSGSGSTSVSGTVTVTSQSVALTVLPVSVAASNVTFTPSGSLSATNAQTAITEASTDLDAHIADTVDAHAASAISFTPTGTIASTTAQAAITEVATDAAAAYALIAVNDRLLAAGGTAVWPLSTSTANVATIGTSGAVMMNGFRCARTESIKGITVYTGTTAAGATPTVCRLGLYERAGNGDWTLVASTANDTTLFAAANTKYNRDFTSPYTITAGTEYMAAMIVVSAATLPSFIGPTLANTTGHLTDMAAISSSRCSGRTGYSDLPASMLKADQESSPTFRTFQAILTPNS